MASILYYYLKIDSNIICHVIIECPIRRIFIAVRQ